MNYNIYPMQLITKILHLLMLLSVCLTNQLTSLSAPALDHI